MSQDTDLRPVQQAIENAIKAIADLPEERNGWLSYFLEAVESDFGEDALIRMSEMLGDRFIEGRW